MIRVKFIQDHKSYKKGDIESFSNNEAFGLVDSGKAVISKDMASQDYKTSSTSGLMPKRATIHAKKEK